GPEERRRPHRRTASLVREADPVPAYLDRAAQAGDSGDPERALAIYERLEGERPEDPRVARALFAGARILEELGRPDEAAQRYERMLGKWPEADPARAARRRLALLYESRGEFDRALALL